MMSKSPVIVQENIIHEFRVTIFKTPARYAVLVEKNGTKCGPTRFFKDKLHASFHLLDQVQTINQTILTQTAINTPSPQPPIFKSESMIEFLARGGTITKCSS